MAETNAPPKPDDGKGIKGWVMKKVMARAGAGVPSAKATPIVPALDTPTVKQTQFSAVGYGLQDPTATAATMMAPMMIS